MYSGGDDPNDLFPDLPDQRGPYGRGDPRFRNRGGGGFGPPGGFGPGGGYPFGGGPMGGGFGGGGFGGGGNFYS